MGKVLPIFIFLFIVSGCDLFKSTSLPSMTAKSDDTEIPTVLVSYLWGAKTQYGIPWEIMQPKPAVTVPKGATINLVFDSEPKEVAASEILNKKDFKEIDIKDKKIVVPETKGIILFSFMQHGLIVEPQIML
ncbi:hypothetical protein ACFQ5D_03905 [Paenibacillus farraposensis]|uniref:EfeO-type cupredoxin-like domain-containing protein n=2 Tax=Paenibacillus farraposensis TaxID=2807095 RepID=A0ABW4D7C7_9BACL|nr:hypothetical protein [Paenibacillus farraposensis]MCC3382184.1 hypothetical protein [Paenibacillus farraposensis]